MNTLEEVMAKLGKSESGCKPFTREEYEQMKVDSYNEGEGTLHLTDGYHCDKCKNKGFIAELRMAEIYGYQVETLVPCRCQKARNALSRLARSGLKDVVKKYTFDGYEAQDAWQEKIKEAAQRFCDTKGDDWFFIGGQSGAGKTHICTAIAVHFIRQGKSMRYMVWPEEIQGIQAVVNDAEKYDAIMRELQETEVLYIDDLFKYGRDEWGNMKPPSEPEVRRAFAILNHRYNKPGLITIISSERTMKELEAIDVAVAGRITEKSQAGGYCINLARDGKKNWRMKGIVEL